jgi:hypothetical protein
MLKVTLLPWRFKQHAFAGLVLIKSIGSGAGFRVLSAVEMGVYFLFHIKRSLLPNLFGTKRLFLDNGKQSSPAFASSKLQPAYYNILNTPQQTIKRQP